MGTMSYTVLLAVDLGPQTLIDTLVVCMVPAGRKCHGHFPPTHVLFQPVLGDPLKWSSRPGGLVTNLVLKIAPPSTIPGPRHSSDHPVCPHLGTQKDEQQEAKSQHIA